MLFALVHLVLRRLFGFAGVSPRPSQASDSSGPVKNRVPPGPPRFASYIAASACLSREGASVAEKGNTAYDRFASHLAAALEEFQTPAVEVHTREWSNRA